MQRILPPAHEVLAEALGQSDVAVRHLLRALDPWHPEFGAQAAEAFDDVAKDVAKAARWALSDLSADDALRQAWCVAMQAPLWAGVLFRAAAPRLWPWKTSPAQAGALAQERERLAQLTWERWRDRIPRHHAGDTALASMLFCTDTGRMPVPDLGGHTGLTGGTRLRLRLAALGKAGATLPTLLKAAAHQPKATDSQRRRELTHALRSLRQAGRRWRPLREVEVAFLSAKEEHTLLSLRSMWPEVLVSPLRGSCQHTQQRVRALRLERERIEGVFAKVMEAVRRVEFGGPKGVDATLLQLSTNPQVTRIADIAISPTLREAIKRLAKEPWNLGIEDFKHPAMDAAFGPWQPMSADAFAFLQRGTPQALPPWWTLTSEQIAERLISGEIKASVRQGGLPYQDLCAIRRSWPLPLQVRLIAHGLGHVIAHDSQAWDELPLEQFAQAISPFGHSGRGRLAQRLAKLPDARPWLTCMAQAEARQVGGAWALRELARISIEESVRTSWKQRRDASWAAWVQPCEGTPEWKAVQPLMRRSAL